MHEPEACFACTSPAANRYTIRLEGDQRLEGKYLCGTCLRELRAESWIEVHERSQSTSSATTDGQAERTATSED